MRSITRALLSAYETADDRERRHLHSMRTLLETATSPFDRTHMLPGHFTASAFVLSPARNSLLLIHHSKLRRWLQPGGHFETHDPAPWDVARREVGEETGLVDMNAFAAPDTGSPLLLDVDVHAIPAHGGAAAHLHHDLRFLFLAESLGVIAGDGVEATRWVPFYELPRLTRDESILRAVRKIDAMSHAWPSAPREREAEG